MEVKSDTDIDTGPNDTPEPPEAHESVLLVDDENIVSDVISEFLRRAGYPHVCARSGEQALKLYHEHKPAIIITDICMPGMDGIELLRTIHRDNPDARVVVMTGYGDENVAIEALRAGASNFIKKPIKLEEFLFIVQAHERMIRAHRRQRLPAECIIQESKTLRLPTDNNLIYAAAYNVTSALHGLLPRQEIDAILLALTEALTNAVEHGNLGIGYEAKSEALQNNSYRRLLREKLRDPELARRTITLEFLLTPAEVWIRVTDEGSGFDWRNLPDPHDPQNMVREHGRGLSIIGLFMDEMGFNEAGSQIWMAKMLKPDAMANREVGPEQ